MLKHISASSIHLTQRDFAGSLGISLGKTHYCLTELIKKGHVKATRFKNSRNKAAYAYIRLRPKSSDDVSIKISDELIVDLSPDGTVYGIELLNANEQLMQGDNGRFLFYNEHSGQEVDVSIPKDGGFTHGNGICW